MVDRGQDVVEGNRPIQGYVARFGARADDEPPLQSAAGQNDGADFGPIAISLESPNFLSSTPAFYELIEPGQAFSTSDKLFFPSFWLNCQLAGPC